MDCWKRFVADDEETWPPLNELVLICGRFGNYGLGSWTGEDWYDQENDLDDGFDPELTQRAWQPLPEPWVGA